MSVTFDSFEEIAHGVIYGKSIFHGLSDHTGKDCIPWQKGVLEFAKYLDEKGYKVKYKRKPRKNA